MVIEVQFSVNQTETLALFIFMITIYKVQQLYIK